MSIQSLSNKELKKKRQEMLLRKELRIDAKLKRKGKRNIKVYLPHKKQEKFHKCSDIVRIVLGGNDSGKSVAGGTECIYWVTKTHPYLTWVNEYEGPIHALVVAVNHEQQTRPGGPQDNILKWLPEDVIEKVIYIRGNIVSKIVLKDASTITFFSSQSDRTSLQGARLTLVWVDEEISIPTYKFWNEIITRVESGRRLYIWITATPSLDDTPSWMDDTIYKDANKEGSKIRLFRFTLDDNPYIIKEAKEDIKDLLQGDEAEKNARLYGLRQQRGRIFDNFSRSIHVIPPLSLKMIKSFKAIWRIIDPHEAKPIAVAWVGVSATDHLIAFDELYEQGLVSQVADWIMQRSDPFKHLIKRNIIDYTIGNKKSRTQEGKSISNDFRDHGIPVFNCVKDLNGGINRLKEYLYHEENQPPRFYITANCTIAIDQMTQYRRDAKGEVVKNDDDFPDMFRYWVCDQSFRPYVKTDNVSSFTNINNMDQITLQNQNKKSRNRRRQEMIEEGIGR